jgi:putative membrane protein
LAQSSLWVTALEQASFLAAGLLLWLSCTATAGDRRSGSRAAGVFGLLLTSIHMTLLGALLALSSRPLYGLGEVTCLGLRLDAQQDQALGGVLMLLIGGAVYLAGGLVLLARLLSGENASGRAVG